MRIKWAAIILIVLVAVSVTAVVGLWWYAARRTSSPPSLPVARSQGKWRLAYYQGGDYIDYAASLRALAGALAEQGWMDRIEIPAFDDPEDATSVWQFLSDHAASEYIEFAADAFWSAGWDDAVRQSVREDAIARLAHGGDVDLVIAMGTWAGQDLANDAHAVPTMVLTSSDPIQAGIIHSADDSGYDHVFVEVDPGRYRRKIRLFHDVVGFGRLGVVYEDSADGRVYANVADLEQVAAERGFELVRCYAEIAPHIDALWIGAHSAEQPKYMPRILAPMFEHRVPTWTQTGSLAVQRGAMISIQPIDFEAAGRWYASIAGQILNGARPRALDQIFEMPDRVVINLETARRIGFEVPKGVLSIADQTYQTIEGD